MLGTSLEASELVAVSLFIKAISAKEGLVSGKVGGSTKAFGDSGFPGFLVMEELWSHI